MSNKKKGSVLLTSLQEGKNDKSDSSSLIVLPVINQSALLSPNRSQECLINPITLNNSSSLIKNIKPKSFIRSKQKQLSAINLLNSFQMKNLDNISVLYKATNNELNKIKRIKKEFLRLQRNEQKEEKKKKKREASAFSNISSIPKDKSNHSLITIDNRSYRTPNYEVYPIELRKKAGFYPKIEIFNYNKVVVNSLDFQRNVILDEFSLVFENYFSFKKKFYNASNGNVFIEEIFPNLSIEQQKETNLLIEETIALIMEIPFYLLGTYYNNINTFISKPFPKLDIYEKTKIFSEQKWFEKNLSILHYVINYLLLVKEMYLELLNEVNKEMIIEYKKFNILKGYFERIRFNITTLTNIAKNNIEYFKLDMKILNNFNEAAERALKSHSIRYKGHDLNNAAEKIIGQIINPKEGEHTKRKRINNILNNEKNDINEDVFSIHRKKKEYIVSPRKERPRQKELINSKLIQDMFKYCKSDIQNQLMALKSHNSKVFIN